MKIAQRFIALTAVLTGVMLLGGCAYMTELRMRPQYKMAEKAYLEKDYTLAATRYESLLDRFPNTPRREMLMLNQADALFKINSYHSAQGVYLDYLKGCNRGEFSGRYVTEAKAQLRKIDVLMSPPRPVDKAALEQAKADLNQLQRLRLQHPNDPDVAYAIGNLFWEMGNYNEMVRYYNEALTINAAYEEKGLIKERMVIGEDGKPVPITPAKQREIEISKHPLVIYNVHDYKANQTDNDYLSGNPERYFDVTGMIRNQGNRRLRNVRIEVRFLNANLQVLSVDNVSLGTMSPDGVRAFHARADSYDNLYNIQSFTCTPFFE